MTIKPFCNNDCKPFCDSDAPYLIPLEISVICGNSEGIETMLLCRNDSQWQRIQ